MAATKCGFGKIKSVSSVKLGGGNVMVWGCMATSGVGNLVSIESTMRKEEYLKILRKDIQPSVRKLGLEDDWTFHQDNGPKQVARM